MTTALTIPQRELKATLSKPDMQEAFRRVLGDNAGAFMASILTAVNLNDSLKYCASDSIINAAMLAASLDLPIEHNLGQAWLIPYNSKEGKRAQFQIGYKGMIQLALRTGEYETIHAGEIYNGVRVKINPITGKVDAEGEPINNEVVGYIAYFKLRNGFERALYMTLEETTEHAKRYSKSFGKMDSPWHTHPHEMGKKTVLKRLLTKYGYLSVKMTRAVSVDDTPMERVDTSDLLNVVDAEETPRPKQSREKNLEELTGQKQPRPWSAEHVREKIQGWMADLKETPLDENAIQHRRKVLAAVLDKVMGDKTRRYEVCEFLTGKASTADMWEEAIALLNWLGVSRFEEVVSQDVKAEIEAVHKEALKVKGQMQMEGVA